MNDETHWRDRVGTWAAVGTRYRVGYFINRAEVWWLRDPREGFKLHATFHARGATVEDDIDKALPGDIPDCWAAAHYYAYRETQSTKRVTEKVLKMLRDSGQLPGVSPGS